MPAFALEGNANPISRGCDQTCVLLQGMILLQSPMILHHSIVLEKIILTNSNSAIDSFAYEMYRNTSEP